MLVQPYNLALDQGTTSSRVILFKHTDQIVKIAQKEFKQYCPQPGKGLERVADLRCNVAKPKYQFDQYAYYLCSDIESEKKRKEAYK
jgi:hypothetical protein